MQRAHSLLSSLRSPFDGAPSPFSFVETVETSPVEELREPSTYLRPPTPAAPDLSGRGKQAGAKPWNVRLLPIAFTVTYWCGLAVLYAFLVYVMVCSSTWRGPVIIWAALIPSVVFRLWRRLPDEQQRLNKMCDEIVLQRCGGYYALADPQAAEAEAETEMREVRVGSRERQRSSADVGYAGLA